MPCGWNSGRRTRHGQISETTPPPPARVPATWQFFAPQQLQCHYCTISTISPRGVTCDGRGEMVSSPPPAVAPEAVPPPVAQAAVPAPAPPAVAPPPVHNTGMGDEELDWDLP